MKFLKPTLFASLFFGVMSAASAQPDFPGDEFDCDCPPLEVPQFVCVEIDNGIVAFPDPCIAECLGFTIVEGDCDISDYPGDGWDGNFPGDPNLPGDPGFPGDEFGCDCDEPTDADQVCVELEEGFIVPFPSACLADCLGLVVVDGDCESPNFPGDPSFPGDPGLPGDGLECDCPEPSSDDFVCVVFDEGYITLFPSACIAECLGFEVVESDCSPVFDPNLPGDPGFPGDPDFPGDGLECDCEEFTEADFVCVELEEGFIVPFPSACLAECLGFTVVDGDCGTYTDPNFPGDGTDGENGNGNGNGNGSAPGIIGTLPGMTQQLATYPNPTDGQVNLTINGNGDGVVNLDVFSAYGQLVSTQQLQLSAGQQRYEIDLRNLPMGSYIIAVTDITGARYVERVMKVD
jgi:hypothetical protein